MRSLPTLVRIFLVALIFSVAKATLESQMSVCLSIRPSVHLSVTETPQHLRIAPSSLLTIKPIDYQAYQPSSLTTVKPVKSIKPINHQAFWPLSLLTIKPINHWANWPSSLSTSGLLLRLSACCRYIQIENQNANSIFSLLSPNLSSQLCQKYNWNNYDKCFNVTSIDIAYLQNARGW